MFRSWRVLTACAVLLTAVTVFAADAAKIDLKDIKCPVSGQPAKDKEGSSRAYKDAKVFFCCENCPKAFEKEPAKFATKANAQLVATKQAEQVKCPLSGKDLTENTVEVAGVKVAFCCENCPKAVEGAEGDKKLELVFSDKAFEKGFKVKKPETK